MMKSDHRHERIILVELKGRIATAHAVKTASPFDNFNFSDKLPNLRRVLQLKHFNTLSPSSPP